MGQPYCVTVQKHTLSWGTTEKCFMPEKHFYYSLEYKKDVTKHKNRIGAICSV